MIPASRCNSRLVSEHSNRFEGAPGELLNRALAAQSPAELAALQTELTTLRAQPGTAIASMVIGQALETRARRLRSVAAREQH